MGAWATGNFENDSALDWIGSLRESGSASAVRTALRQVIEQSKPQDPSFVGRLLGRRPVEPYLEAPIACEGLAAAEIVACWLGHPPLTLPEGVDAWARDHAGEVTAEYFELARQAVATIKTKSELKDLWENGDAANGTEWHTVIADLESRLQS